MWRRVTNLKNVVRKFKAMVTHKTVVIQKYTRRFLVNINRKRYMNEKIFHKLGYFDELRAKVFSDSVLKFARRWREKTAEMKLMRENG